MAPSKVALYAIGALALLGDASAEPFGTKTRLPKAFPVGRAPENLYRLNQEVGDLARRLSGHEAVRRLQGPPSGPDGSGGTGSQKDPSDPAQNPPASSAPTTYIDVWTDEAGQPTCNYDPQNHKPDYSTDVQPFVDGDMCLDEEDGTSSQHFGFDGRSVIHREFRGLGCDRARLTKTTVYPCGCVMGIEVKGHLCADVPPPKAHFTMDMEMPGTCAPDSSSSSVVRMPVWEGCQVASSFISGQTIEHMKQRNQTEVYANVHMMGDSMVYSVGHSDWECKTPPAELFMVSCECNAPVSNMTMDLFEGSWYLTGDVCKTASKADVRVFMFPGYQAPCDAQPIVKASFGLDMCQPSYCSWDAWVGMPCDQRTSMQAVADPETRTVSFHEYYGSYCQGEPFQTGELNCAQGCVDLDEWERMPAAQYIKMTGPYCTRDGRPGGSCKMIPKSDVPREIRSKLVPCMGEPATSATSDELIL